MPHRDNEGGWTEARAADRERRIAHEIDALDAEIAGANQRARADDAVLRRATEPIRVLVICGLIAGFITLVLTLVR